MTCAEFHEAIQRFLDGDVPSLSEALEAHRRLCSECGATYAAAVELLRGVQLAPWPAPPPDLASQVVAQVLHEQSRHARVVRRTFIAAAVAAALLLATTFVTWMPRDKNTAPSSQPRLAERVSTNTDTPAMLSLDPGVAEAGSALASLVEVTARETVKQGESLFPRAVPAPPLADLGTLQQSLDPPAQSLRQAGQSLTASLEPVTDSARRAYFAFVHDFSPVE